MVCSLRLSSRAVSRLLRPSATRATTCSSRGVRSWWPPELSTRSDGTSEIRSSRKVICSVLAQICPAGDALDAAAEQAEVRVGDAEDAAGTGAEGADHQFAVVGLDQKNFGDCGMGEMNAAHGRHLVGDVDGVIQREHNDFGRSGGDGLKD